MIAESIWSRENRNINIVICIELREGDENEDAVVGADRLGMVRSAGGGLLCDTAVLAGDVVLR